MFTLLLCGPTWAEEFVVNQRTVPCALCYCVIVKGPRPFTGVDKRSVLEMGLYKAEGGKNERNERMLSVKERK